MSAALGDFVFNEQLQKIVNNVDGGLGGVVMGTDDIDIDKYLAESENVDITTMGMEFSFILTKVQQAANMLEIGGLNEMSINSDHLTMLMRLITNEYFLGVVMKSDGNIGKCRYMMRLGGAKLTEEF